MHDVNQRARPDDDDWALMLRRVRRGRCVPFLGAGASRGFDGRIGLPTAGELARQLAERCRFPGADPSDFFRVTQYFRMVTDDHELRTVVRELLSVPGARPSKVHETLAGLPIEYVLTTNFDKLMERAFEDAGKPGVRQYVYERRGNATDLPNATLKEPIVYKLHGSLENLPSMVLTEDDIVDFLACLIAGEPRIPSTVTTLFSEYSILFIGYGLKDINVRVMLRALRGRRERQTDIRSFAIQRLPQDPTLAREWQQTVMFLRNRELLDCYDMDAVAFVSELKERFDRGEGAI